MWAEISPSFWTCAPSSAPIHPSPAQHRQLDGLHDRGHRRQSRHGRHSCNTRSRAPPPRGRTHTACPLQFAARAPDRISRVTGATALLANGWPAARSPARNVRRALMSPCPVHVSLSVPTKRHERLPRAPSNPADEASSLLSQAGASSGGGMVMKRPRHARAAEVRYSRAHRTIVREPALFFRRTCAMRPTAAGTARHVCECNLSSSSRLRCPSQTPNPSQHNRKRASPLRPPSSPPCIPAAALSSALP